jgi:hypothetical protein
MTTIVVRDGIMAADSCVTYSTEEGGSRRARCTKLYRKFVALHSRSPDGQSTVDIQDVLIGVAGESGPGLVFVDSVFTQAHDVDETRELFTNASADFTALVLTRNGLFEYDAWYRGELVREQFWAIGSGTKVALGAMEHGASAGEAVRAACRWDVHTRGPVVSARLLPADTDYQGDTMREDVAKGIIEITTEAAQVSGIWAT